jgi:chromosome condensin MukBEF MukE localization factor
MSSAKILCPEKLQLYKAINLSTNSVADSANDLAENMQCQLKRRGETFFIYLLGRSGPEFTITEATYRPIIPALLIDTDDFGAVGGMND